MKGGEGVRLGEVVMEVVIGGNVSYCLCFGFRNLVK